MNSIIIKILLLIMMTKFIYCPLPPSVPLARTVLRLIINLPEQPFNDEMYRNTSQHFIEAAKDINEAFDQFWQAETAYRGSNVIRFRYQQVFGTMATINVKFDLPLNSSTAVLHRLKWELMRALKDGRIGWVHASVDGFEFLPVEGVD